MSLSGGVDSSTVAVLVHLMVALGGRELGLERLAEKLGHITGLRKRWELPAMRLLINKHNGS